MTYVKKCSEFLAEQAEGEQQVGATTTAPAPAEEQQADPKADASAYAQAKSKVDALFNGNMDEQALQDAYNKATADAPNKDALNFHFATKKLEAKKVAMENQIKAMNQQLGQRTAQLAQIEKAVQGQ